MMQRRSPFNELRQMQDNMDRMWRRFGTFNHEDGSGMEAWGGPAGRCRPTATTSS